MPLTSLVRCFPLGSFHPYLQHLGLLAAASASSDSMMSLMRVRSTTNPSRHQHSARWRRRLCELCISELYMPAAMIFTSALIFCVLYGSYLAAWLSMDKARPYWRNLLMGCSLPLGVILHVALLCLVAYFAYMRRAAAPPTTKRRRELPDERTPLLVERVPLLAAADPRADSGSAASEQGIDAEEEDEEEEPQQKHGGSAKPTESAASMSTESRKEESEVHADIACPICVTNMAMSRGSGAGTRCDEHYLLKTVCGHTFHESCLCQWLKRRTNCPVCRRDLRGGDHAA